MESISRPIPVDGTIKRCKRWEMFTAFSVTSCPCTWRRDWVLPLLIILSYSYDCMFNLLISGYLIRSFVFCKTGCSMSPEAHKFSNSQLITGDPIPLRSGSDLREFAAVPVCCGIYGCGFLAVQGLQCETDPLKTKKKNIYLELSLLKKCPY